MTELSHKVEESQKPSSDRIRLSDGENLDALYSLVQKIPDRSSRSTGSGGVHCQLCF